MKKIRKLALSPEQCMSPEEQTRVLGGGHVCTGYSWNCQCTKVGNTCEQVWTYDWSLDWESGCQGVLNGITGGNSARNATNGLSKLGAYSTLIMGAYLLYDAYESGYELYQVQRCIGISSGSKSHTPVGNISRR